MFYLLNGFKCVLCRGLHTVMVPVKEVFSLYKPLTLGETFEYLHIPKSLDINSANLAICIICLSQVKTSFDFKVNCDYTAKFVKIAMVKENSAMATGSTSYPIDDVANSANMEEVHEETNSPTEDETTTVYIKKENNAEDEIAFEYAEFPVEVKIEDANNDYEMPEENPDQDSDAFNDSETNAPDNIDDGIAENDTHDETMVGNAIVKEEIIGEDEDYDYPYGYMDEPSTNSYPVECEIDIDFGIFTPDADPFEERIIVPRIIEKNDQETDNSDENNSNSVGQINNTRGRPLIPPAKTRYYCDVCNKSFSRSNLLKVHKYSHPSAIRLHCMHCNQRFPNSRLLNRHELLHADESITRPSISSNGPGSDDQKFFKFQCTVCNKSFCSKIILEDHELRHGKEVMYVCGVCDKLFSRECNLRKHLPTHTK